MTQIVCLSSSEWYHAYPTSKQEIISRLPGCEVLYFDPPVTYLAPLRDKSAKARLTLYQKDQPHPQENITVYALPPVLPFGNKLRLINRVNHARAARFIRRKMVKHGFTDPVLWTYLPGHCDIADKIPSRALVYHCVDRHSGYRGFITPEVVDAMEAELTERCTVIFATAEGLRQRLSAFNQHTYLIPNGVDYELFSKAQNPLPVPAELADISGPVLGFTGALQECLDYELLRALALARPEYTLVFIGRINPDAAVDKIRDLDNVRILPVRPRDTLPPYMARFDVCLNAFRSGDLARDVSPLKFYDYLATGKPIVTTPQPLQVLDFQDAVLIADGVDAFIRACDAALLPDDDRRARRITYAKTCSWNARAERMISILDAHGVLHPPEAE